MSDSQSNHLKAADEHDGNAASQEAERIRRKRQRARSLAIAWALALLALLFFIVTIVRLGPMVANRPL